MWSNPLQIVFHGANGFWVYERGRITSQKLLLLLLSHHHQSAHSPMCNRTIRGPCAIPALTPLLTAAP